MSRVFKIHFHKKIKLNDFKALIYRNRNSEEQIYWKIGLKNIVSEILLNESNGRIFITNTNRIKIRKVRISDTNIYRYIYLKTILIENNTMIILIIKLFDSIFDYFKSFLLLLLLLSLKQVILN